MPIAALIALLAGAALQYKASTDAQGRTRAAIARSLDNQRQLQEEAEKMAMDQAKEFAPEDRKTAQDKFAQEIEENLITPVSDASVIRSQQTATQGDVSNDYSTAKAQSDANVMKDAEQLARILGKTGSASRLRTNEALKMAETGLGIDRLSNFSRGRQAADAIGIQQAGQIDPGLTLAGSLLQAGGAAGMMAGAGSAASGSSGSVTATASTSANPAAPFATGGGGLGFTGNGSLGFKIPKSFVWS